MCCKSCLTLCKAIYYNMILKMGRFIFKTIFFCIIFPMAIFIFWWHFKVQVYNYGYNSIMEKIKMN